MDTNLINLLEILNNDRSIVKVRLSCRLGNPPEEVELTKSGYISDLDINKEKPRQTSFYINYLEEGPGGAVRFKVHPHEVITVMNMHDFVVYELAPSA